MGADVALAARKSCSRVRPCGGWFPPVGGFRSSALPWVSFSCSFASSSIAAHSFAPSSRPRARASRRWSSAAWRTASGAAPKYGTRAVLSRNDASPEEKYEEFAREIDRLRTRVDETLDELEDIAAGIDGDPAREQEEGKGR